LSPRVLLVQRIARRPRQKYRGATQPLELVAGLQVKQICTEIQHVLNLSMIRSAYGSESSDAKRQRDFTPVAILFRLFQERCPPAKSRSRGAILPMRRTDPDDTPFNPRMNTMRQGSGTIYASTSRGMRRAHVPEAPTHGNVSMSGRATIMVVDDEPDVREVLEEYFVSHGYAVLGAESAGAARELAAAHPIDLALVDINMPGEDGLSLARHLRERYAQIAIVMLTSAATVVDRIVGLEMGADDYVPKPFDPRELAARVKSVLRRTSAAGRADLGAARLRIGRCVLDVDAHRLSDENGREVPMSPLEFDLLKALASHPNRALSRERILNLNQQRDWDPFDRSVDLRIMRLRKKIEPDPEHPRFIRTVRNEGYIFVPDGA
jgi:DNA-binding response OmpR family regulator